MLISLRSICLDCKTLILISKRALKAACISLLVGLEYLLGMQPPAKLSDLENIFTNVVQAILAFAGVVLFILILLGGLKYITSAGDPKAMEGAQKTITYAIGGLIVILISYIILVFIAKVTGIDANILTQFKIVGR